MGKTIQQIPHSMGTYYLLDVKPDKYLLTYQSYDGFGNKKGPVTKNVPFNIDELIVNFDQRHIHFHSLLTFMHNNDLITNEWLIQNNIKIKSS